MKIQQKLSSNYHQISSNTHLISSAGYSHILVMKLIKSNLSSCNPYAVPCTIFIIKISNLDAKSLLLIIQLNTLGI